jgi:hypothetical protein
MASSELERHNLALQVAGIGPVSLPTSTPNRERLGYLWTSDSLLEGETTPLNSENFGDSRGTATFKSPDMNGGASATIRSNELNVEKLGGVGDSIDVFEAGISFSAFDFEIRGNTFNVELWRSAERNPSFEIVGDTSKTQTKIVTTATNGELEGNAAWVRDETIFFEMHDPDGDNPGEYLVKRGFYISPEQNHLDGTKIFESIPYWDKRKVRLFTWTYNEDSNGHIPLTRRYLGEIDGSTQHDHNRIIVPSVGQGTSLRGLNVNEDAFTEDETTGSLQIDWNPKVSEGDKLRGVKGRLRFNAEGGESKVVKPNEYNDGTDLRTWIQIEGKDKEIIFPYDGEVKGKIDELFTIGFNGSRQSTDIIPFDFERSDIPNKIADIWEPFIVHRIFDDKSDTTYSHTREITQFSDHDDKYIYHPVSIVACLLMSTYSQSVDAENFDVLHGNWGSGAYALLSRSFPDDVRGLVENNPGDRVDQVVMGLNGSREQLWEKVSSILVQHGYYWSIKENGSLTIKKLTNADVKFWSDAQGNVITPVESSTLMTDDGRDEVIDTLEGRVGKVGDFVQPKPIQVQVRELKPNLSQKLSRQVDQDIDFTTFVRSNFHKAEDRLRTLAALQSDKLPKFQFQVDDYLNESPEPSYSLGDAVSIEQIPLAKKWIARDGTQQRIDKSQVKFAGRIISRTYLPQKRAYEIEIELVGVSLARWRSPSGVVKSIDQANNKIELEDEDDGGSEVLRGGDPFNVGDEIQIFSEDGKKVDSNIQEIQSISDDTLTLDGFGYSTNPSAGDIVELSYFDTDNSSDGYENSSVLPNIDRAYTALADTDSTIGDADEDADIYGAR